MCDRAHSLTALLEGREETRHWLCPDHRQSGVDLKAYRGAFSPPVAPGTRYTRGIIEQEGNSLLGILGVVLEGVDGLLLLVVDEIGVFGGHGSGRCQVRRVGPSASLPQGQDRLV